MCFLVCIECDDKMKEERISIENNCFILEIYIKLFSLNLHINKIINKKLKFY